MTGHHRITFSVMMCLVRR